MKLRGTALVGVFLLAGCAGVPVVPAHASAEPEVYSAQVPETDELPSSAAAPTRSALPALLQEVETKYANAATLQAEFAQINESAALKTKKSTSGRIMVKRPDKLRWETLKPDMSVLVSDGKKFWFYTPPFDEDEHGQVIERKSAETNSKLANALLSGRFSAARDMRIKAQGKSRFVLTPKPGSAGTVSRATIDIEPEKKLIQKVILDHRGGNRSEITLSHIELGKPMDDDLFIFTAPPNTDKVTQ
jgi:outer membrane lipoprotein carrier protein